MQVELVKEIYYIYIFCNTGVKVNSIFYRCESCEVSLYLHNFKIYHICHDLFPIKKKTAREPLKSSGKGGTVIKNTTKNEDHKKLPQIY